MKYTITLILSECTHIMLYALACIIPKTKNRWVFGAWFGKTYNDNSKYLFEYVNQLEKSITAVWITRNPEVKKYVRAMGYKAYFTYEPLGIWYMLTAHVALFCQNKQHDLAGDCIGPKTKLIQLWHGFSYKKYLGTNPIRMPVERPHTFVEKIVLLFARIMLRKKYASINDLPYRVENWHSYSMICALSNRHKRKFLDVYDFKKSEITVLDYPRNDGLFHSHFTSSFTDHLTALRTRGSRVGYFMPTYRKTGKTVPQIFLPNIEILANYCEKNNIHLFFKPHQNDLADFESHIKKYSHLHVLTTKEVLWDLYPTLQFTDFVITDYSSIVSDYIHLNKPIIFVPFDKKDFMTFPGLYPDYEKLTQSRSASNWEEAIRLLDSVRQSKPLIHNYKPYHFSKTAFNKIKSITQVSS